MLKVTLVIFSLVILVTSTMAVDLTKPIAEIRLKDGSTLRNVEIKSYSATSILVRHANGAGSIKYTQLPDEIYDAILAYREESPSIAKAIPEDALAIRYFVKSLSSPLPENLTIDEYYLTAENSDTAVLRGRYTADFVAGTNLLPEFVLNIHNSPNLAARYKEVKLTKLSRNQAGELDYEITLKHEPTVEPQVPVSAQPADPVKHFLELSRDDQLTELRKGRPKLPPVPVLESKWGEKAILKPQLAGQIFITTKGGATFKMSGVAVKVFPNSYAKTLLNWVTSPSQPAVACMDFYSEHKDSSSGIYLLYLMDDLKLSTWASVGAGATQTTTDADGRFDIASPFSDYAIFATASRKIGEKTEYYVWLLTSDNVPEKDKILLTGSNMIDSWTSTDDR